MSVTISFSKKDIWLVANWAFRRLYDDIQERYVLNQDEQYVFEQAMALGGLNFEYLNKSKIKILNMIKNTIIELINDDAGSLRNKLDVKGYSMYREALPELMGYIEEYENNTMDGQVDGHGDSLRPLKKSLNARKSPDRP